MVHLDRGFAHQCSRISNAKTVFRFALGIRYTPSLNLSFSTVHVRCTCIHRVRVCSGRLLKGDSYLHVSSALNVICSWLCGVQESGWISLLGDKVDNSPKLTARGSCLVRPDSTRSSWFGPELGTSSVWWNWTEQDQKETCHHLADNCHVLFPIPLLSPGRSPFVVSHWYRNFLLL